MMDAIWEKMLANQLTALEVAFKEGTLKIGDKLPLMFWEGNLTPTIDSPNATYTELIITSNWKEDLRKHYEEKLVKA